MNKSKAILNNDEEPSAEATNDDVNMEEKRGSKSLVNPMEGRDYDFVPFATFIENKKETKKDIDDIKKKLKKLAALDTDSLIKKIDRQDKYLDTRIDDVHLLINDLDIKREEMKDAQIQMMKDIDDLQKNKVNTKNQFEPTIKHIQNLITNLNLKGKGKGSGDRRSSQASIDENAT